MISTANGTLKFVFKEDLSYVVEELTKSGVMKEVDGVLAIYQYDDPTPHLYNPVDYDKGILTVPYGQYENFEETFKQIISSATEVEVECWSVDPFEVIYFKNNKTHKIKGLKALPFYSELTKAAIESFDSDKWDAAEESGEDEELYTDENRDKLNSSVIESVLAYMKKSRGL